MVDKNIRTDYKKLKMLVDIDRQNKGENRLSTIQEIVNTGETLVTLKTSFPADEMTFDDNFRSLLFYYGMLTICGTYRGQLRMCIPNNCVRAQYYSFLLKYFQTETAIELGWFTRVLGNLAFDGEWRPFFEKLAEVYSVNSSVRNLINGEHALQGFFRAFLSIADYYLMMPELEMNHGYSDIFLIADRKKYPDIAHSYLLELKYAKQGASEAEVSKLRTDAMEQLERYSDERLLAVACADTRLHRMVVVFRGFEMVVCEEV